LAATQARCKALLIREADGAGTLFTVFIVAVFK
jgi:hypothetical protein